ncbi:MAG: DNA polymerase IV [Burkholderiaceae bacterium]
MDTWPKIVVHADMDAFYAAVEQLDNPDLRGKPILVGPNTQRGVVLTASYEARPFRVGSAMPMAVARRRCPQAVIVPPRFERYKAISKQVMDVFADFSAAIEPLSLDEAFLDMSGSCDLFGPPHVIGQKIKDAVREATGLYISVGVSGTKYVAKVASAHDKPNGLTVIPPDQAVEWLAPMPVSRLWGVGEKTAKKLNALGFRTIGDIAAASAHDLEQRLGASGLHFYHLANAQDPREVTRGRSSKSIGSERTLREDVSSRADIERYLRLSADRIARRLREKNYVAGGIRVRLKTSSFELLTRQGQLTTPDDTADSFFTIACRLLDTFSHRGPFRLVGMAAYDLDWRQPVQQAELFSASGVRELETTIDKLIQQFGKGVLRRAKDLNDSGPVSDADVNLDFMDYQDGERLSAPGRANS